MVNQNLNKTSIFVKGILLLTIISFLVFLLTPMVFTGDANTTIPVWGWTAIFGGLVSASINTLEFTFNWTLFILWLLILVIGMMTYFIGQKSRGFYIFAAVVQVLLAIFIFTIASSWMVTSWISGNSDLLVSLLVLGVGPWMSGFIALINAVLGIIEFRVAALR